jgi:hypothetical protein
MKLSVTKKINNIADKAFKTMLLKGAFPEVNYSKTNGWESFSMFEFCDVWGKFTKILDRKIQETTGDKLGIFSRKSNAKFLAMVEELANDIVEADVMGQREHFRTFADDMNDYVAENF